VAKSGARAIATGSASVAMAHGFGDGQEVSMDFALDNARRIVATVDLPVTVDFEGGYAVEPDQLGQNLAKLAATGAVGCNFEDQVVGGDGLYSIPDQAARIAAVRSAVGPDFFINCRTDLFLKAPQETHDAEMLDEAILRARAYAEAGASGFFVPMLGDLDLLRRLCAESPIPVNFMTYPGCPSNADVAATGVARISHGPFPYMALMGMLEEAARAALA
jgi:2-methylisocitrate lyase-like PEP mutase family enzyme